MTRLIGRARTTTGPLRWGGPFGRVPVFRGANLATTQAQVDLDAATTLERLTAPGDVTLSLQTLAHPAMQMHDRASLEAPRNLGTATIEGRITAMTLTAARGVISKSMSAQLTVPAATLDLINQQA